MKFEFKKAMPVFILIYCLIVIPLFLYYFSTYLQTPSSYTWNEVEKYLLKTYDKEPLIFNPSWLKNYATDHSRFQQFNIAEKNSDFYAFWLVSMNKKIIPDNYQAESNKQIGNLFILKLIKK